MNTKPSHIKSRAICVLGMHRSGTSTISRAVNLLGAYLGEEKDLYGPAPDNPEGYWERKEIVDFQDRLLSHLKRKWDTAAPFPDGWFLADEMRPYVEELTNMVKKAFSDQPLWAWKDPRTCILFDLWKHLLGGLDVDLSCVFVVRNPLDVANSLKKRDGFTLDRSYGIWFNYNIAALRQLSGVSTVFVSYDRFLENSEAELRKCAAGLGIEWPADDSQLKELLRSFVRTDLRHSLSDMTALKAAPVPVQSLYALLTEALDDPSSVAPPFFEKAEQLYEDFYSYARFFQSDLTALWERNRQIAELQREQENSQRLLAERNQRIAQFDNWLAEWKQDLARKNDELTGLEGKYRDKCHEVVSRDQEIIWLEEEVQQRDERIRQVNDKYVELDHRFKEKCHELLAKDQELQSLAEERGRERERLEGEIRQRDEHVKQLSDKLAGIEKEYKDKCLELQAKDEDLRKLSAAADAEQQRLGEEVARKNEQLHRTSDEFAESERLCAEMKGNCQKVDEELRRTSAQAADLQGRMAEADDRLRQANYELDGLKEALEARSRKVTVKEQELRTLAAEKNSERERFEGVLREKEELVHKLLSSKSWKITAPLRAAYGMVKKGK